MRQGFIVKHANMEAHLGKRRQEAPPRLRDRSSLVLRTAILSRVAVCLFIIAISMVTDDYDTSTTCLQERHAQPLDRLIQSLLSGFAKWDAVYLLRISEAGYEFEQYYGFFPGLPIMMRLVTELVLAPLAPFATIHTRLLISGVLVSNTAFPIAAVVLYRLGCHVLRNEATACVAALLFCINPASVFFSAIYTESLFALASFAGMYFAVTEQCLAASLCFAGASSVRGNGLVSVGFLVYMMIKQLARSCNGQGVRQYRETLSLARGFMWMAIAVSPWFAVQAYGYANYCLAANNAIRSRPWCEERVPLIYAYVQKEYWNNGFLAYYKLKNIPNFAIGLPIIALSFTAITDYVIHLPKADLVTLGLDMGTNPNHTSGFHSRELFVHVVYLAALSFFGLFFMYIQCTTRFICASSPVVFWYAAQTPQRTFAMVVYSLAFTAIGSVLFSNFYPWT